MKMKIRVSIRKNKVSKQSKLPFAEDAKFHQKKNEKVYSK